MSKAMAASFLFLFCDLMSVAPVLANEVFHDPVITIAADPWCPYNCAPEDDQPGYLVEIAKEVYSKHGYQVRYLLMPWKRALESSLHGQIDAAIAAAPTNAPGHYFGKYAVGSDETVIVKRLGQRFSYVDVSSLEGLRIGRIASYNYDLNGPIDSFLDASMTTTTVTDEEPLCILFDMLRRDRIDMFLENKLVVLHALNQPRYQNLGEMVATGVSTPIYFAFQPTSRGRRLAILMDDGLVDLRKTGRLAEILNKYGLKDWGMENENIQNTSAKYSPDLKYQHVKP